MYCQTYVAKCLTRKKNVKHKNIICLTLEEKVKHIDYMFDK